MSQKPVIAIEDITNIALKERRPGCDKGLRCNFMLGTSEGGAVQ